jgi:hypothetical protein
VIGNRSSWSPVESSTATVATPMLIAQPKDYPHDLIAALSRLFKKKDEVKRAWLVLLYNPAQGQPAHILIAVESTGRNEQLLGEAGMVAQAIPVSDPPVEFLQVDPTSSQNYAFLRTTKPFYQRRLFGLF